MADTEIHYTGEVVSLDGAKASGLKRYFTAEPCERGHVAQRMTSNRTCVICLAAKARIRHLRSNDQRNEARNRRRAERVDEERRRGRERYHRTPGQGATKMRLYRAEKPAVVKAISKRSRKKNIARILNANRQRRALEKQADGTHTVEDIAEIRRLQRDRCANPGCRAPLRGGGAVDHIKALVNGGSNDRRNLQLLCTSCNSRKRSKDPVAFAQEQGFLI